MTPTPYTPEMRERDARIAVAMGAHGYFISPAGLIYCIELPAHDALDVGYTRANDPTRIDVVGMKVPEFHASEDARRSLLEWLRADYERWMRFIWHFFLAGDEQSNQIRAAFLATPQQVAEAADAMIKEMSMSKTEACATCNQTDNGQTGEYPCRTCGLPVLHDSPVATPDQVARAADAAIREGEK